MLTVAKQTSTASQQVLNIKEPFKHIYMWIIFPMGVEPLSLFVQASGQLILTGPQMLGP